MGKKNKQFHISSLLAVLLCALLFIALTPAVYAADGSCGDDLTWSFDGSTLTISGSGVMNNYTESNPAPWHEFREQITKLSLPEGLTRIGTRAFAECSSLLTVNIPEEVQIIDDSAFLECTSMTILILNEGIRTIAQSAFEQCESLADVRLPNSLINLGNHAFYMCESLTYVTVPGYVKTIGSGVFCYCSNLVRADIHANVEMPKWSFYGCDKLEVVTIQGTSVEPESLMVSTPPQGVGGGTSSSEPTVVPEQTVVPSNPEGETEVESSGNDTGFVSSENITADKNGQPVIENTTVTQNEDVTITTTNRTPADGNGSTTTTITATVQNDKGWTDVAEKVNSSTIGGNNETVNVTVYLPNSDTVSADVLQQFAGKNVALSIQTKDGSSYTLDCNLLESDVKDDLVLNYTIVSLEEADVPEELKGCTVYRLEFADKAKLSAELVIRLPGGHAYRTATLYQKKGMGSLEKLQSVVVDSYGNAHWYVSAVDHKTKYFIGIDVPGATEAGESPLIPKNLEEDYQIYTDGKGNQYVVSGRSSSWGMNLGQVMGILAGVMVGVIALVGAIMYIWNKSRVKEGYVPGLYDLDDEEDKNFTINN